MAGVRQFNEEEALERAMDVFWRQGFGATTMGDLAEATGVLRGSLYNAYGDKETLFLQVFARYQARFMEAARQALDKPTAERSLRDFFDFTIKSMTEGEPTRGCLTTKTATDETATSQPIKQALQGLLDGLEKLVAERLSRPDARSRLAVAPAEAARLVVTLTRGTVVMERVYGDAASLKSTANALVRMLLPKA